MVCYTPCFIVNAEVCRQICRQACRRRRPTDTFDVEVVLAALPETLPKQSPRALRVSMKCSMSTRTKYIWVTKGRGCRLMHGSQGRRRLHGRYSLQAISPELESNSGRCCLLAEADRLYHSSRCMQSGSVQRELGTKQVVESCGWSGEIDRRPGEDVGRVSGWIGTVA